MESMSWKIHKVLLDLISENMVLLVQNDKYGTIDTTYTTTMANMWLNSWQKLTHYNYKQSTMDKSVLLVN